MTRKETLSQLRDQVARGIPIIGAGAGTGISAKCEELGGADLIVIYNSGRFRMAGRGSMAGLMPYGDANQIVVEMAREVIPVVKHIPVLAGVCGTDPFRLMPSFLEELKKLGFQGVQNFPTVGLFEGQARKNLEETGMGYDREVEMIRIAHDLDLLTTPYAFNPEEARAMARAGADIIVAHVGTTVAGTIGAQSTFSLDDSIVTIQAIHDAAKEINPDVLVICHGGPVAEPEDVEYVFDRTHGIVGFYGASSMERLPVEKAIVENTRRFKKLQIQKGEGSDQRSIETVPGNLLPAIGIIGTLDTKSPEISYLKTEIEDHGFRALIIDVGIFSVSPVVPAVSAEKVAAAGGHRLADLAARRDRGEAMRVMSQGAAHVIKEMHAAHAFDGLIALGGGGGSAIAAAAMRTLPVGFPKLLVSTVAAGNIDSYAGTNDITIMPSVVDVAGLNRVSKTIFNNAAGAICGMASRKKQSVATEKPLIAATMFGNTTRAVDNARRILEERGYEVLVFHATGTGGLSMETLIKDGHFSGVLDMTTTELADEVCGGVMSAGPDRLEAAGRMGIPQLVTPACIDMCNFWGPETMPPQYQERLLYRWNPNVTLMRTTVEENSKMGEILARKLNQALGPVAVMIPMGGFSELDYPGQPFWSPEADQAFLESLRKHLRAGIPIEVSEKDVNDPDFSRRAAERLLELIQQNTEPTIRNTQQ